MNLMYMLMYMMMHESHVSFLIYMMMYESHAHAHIP
jgi:hypothetical protein